MSEKLNSTEQKIYKNIPLGKSLAISQEKLADMNGISKRKTSRYIQQMRLKGYLIGSSRSVPNGYYRIQTTDEFFQVIGMLISNYIALGKTIKAMNETYNKCKDITGQLELFDLLEASL